MRFDGGGKRYTLEYCDPVKGWTVRCSADERAVPISLWRKSPNRETWRVVDRATDTVLTDGVLRASVN
jgi:hypothetical protein